MPCRWHYLPAPADTQYEDWFDSEWLPGHYLYDKSFDGSEYAPFDDWSIPLEAEYLVPGLVLTFKNSYNLPSPAAVDDNSVYAGYNEAGTAAIKLEISRGHGVSIGYRADQSEPGQEIGDDGLLNTTTWAQYDNLPGIQFPTHQVTIVGYDDNYPKENFTRTMNGKTVEGSTPPEDGAFIVKNSWGALTDADGVFLEGEPVNTDGDAIAGGITAEMLFTAETSDTEGAFYIKGSRGYLKGRRETERSFETLGIVFSDEPGMAVTYEDGKLNAEGSAARTRRSKGVEGLGAGKGMGSGASSKSLFYLYDGYFSFGSQREGGDFTIYEVQLR